MLTANGAHDGETLDVTGRDLLSFDGIAGAFARASGRQITYVEETLEEARASMQAYNTADWQVDAWITTYLQIARGELELVGDAVLRLTGHEAISLDDFLVAHPDHYEHLKST